MVSMARRGNIMQMLDDEPEEVQAQTPTPFSFGASKTETAKPFAFAKPLNPSIPDAVSKTEISPVSKASTQGSQARWYQPRQEMSQADWISSFTEGMRKPLSEEEQARRERGIRTAERIGAMSNLASALMNLGAVSKGAKSININPNAQSQMGAYRQYQDAIRSNYTSARQKAIQASYAQYKDDQTFAYKQAAQELQMQKEDVRNKIRMLELDLKAELQKENNEYKQEQLKLQIRRLENDEKRLTMQQNKMENDMYNNNRRTTYQIGKPYYKPEENSLLKNG